MSLEDKIAALTTAIEANTAALSKAGASTAKAGTSTAGAASGGYKPKYDASKMAAALNDVKEKHGMPEAKKIVKEVGGVAKMSEITDAETIDKVYEAAKKRLEEDEAM